MDRGVERTKACKQGNEEEARKGRETMMGVCERDRETRREDETSEKRREEESQAGEGEGQKDKQARSSHGRGVRAMYMRRVDHVEVCRERSRGVK